MAHPVGWAGGSSENEADKTKRRAKVSQIGRRKERRRRSHRSGIRKPVIIARMRIRTGTGRIRKDENVNRNREQ